MINLGVKFETHNLNKTETVLNDVNDTCNYVHGMRLKTLIGSFQSYANVISSVQRKASG